MSWAIFALLVLLFAVLGSETTNKNRAFRLLARIFLILVLAFFNAYLVFNTNSATDRDEYLFFYTNIDSFMFDNIFEWILFSSTQMEIGFLLMMKVFSTMGFSDYVFYFVTLIIINTFAVTVLYKFKFPGIIFLLFVLSEFYSLEINIIRQILACSIGLFGMTYIYEKKVYKFLLCVLFAFLIHKSAILLILFTPFCFSKEHWYPTINTILLFVWIFSLPFGLRLIDVDVKQFSFLFTDTRYDEMLDYLKESQAGIEWFGNLVTLFFFVACENKYKNNFYAVLFVIACISTNIFTSLVTIRRLMLYFTPFYIAYAPIVLTNNTIMTKKAAKNGSKYVLLVIFFLYYFRLIITKL